MSEENIQLGDSIITQEKKIGRFKASRIIARESWNLLKKDKEIMIFPILSMIVSFLVIGVIGILFFLAILGGSVANLGQNSNQSYLIEVAFAFVMYFATVFVTLFFETGIITIVRARFQNQDLTFKDGLNNAFSKMGKIAKWAIVSATVGTILKLISDRSQLLGRIVVAILGAAWSIVTFFIAPILIVEDISIKDSLKKSAEIIRKVWGEAVIINVGVGLFFGFLGLLGFLVFFATIFTKSLAVIISAGVLLVLYLIILSIISSTLSVIFRVVLYEYANTGVVPMGFSAEVINMAFKKNGNKAGINGVI